jgi:asparagine synthase (glutamine-hydrolysing)
MCGICGVIEPVRAGGADSLRSRLEAMTFALRHRGPDGSGVWWDAGSGVALGHRRLAVLDRSDAAAQPMRSGDGRYVLSYNGELYDFQALRVELERSGARFRGHGDTEVLLGAIERWGLESALERVDGMFAFALWDRRERRLSLVRDRIGKKPLYHAWQGDRFLFGSELSALHAHPGFRPEIDPDGLAALVRDSYIPAPRTIHAGVEKLAAGSLLHVRVEGRPRIDSVRRWWDLRGDFEAGARAPLPLTRDAAADAFVERLRAAVRRRLSADVPVGALLSGGIDSAAVVACMRELAPGPLKTFTIGSADARFDESAAARRIAAQLGCEHHTLLATPRRALDLLPRLPALYDEPCADTSQIPMALVSELARGEVTVALSGDGGDELLYGYDRYFACRRRWRALGPLPPGLRRRLARSLRSVDPLRFERAADALEASDIEDLFARANARHPDVATLVPAADPGALPRASPLGVGDPLLRMAWLDWNQRLPESILVKVDRASMGVGLEVRSPLLDASLVSFCARLPRAVKLASRERKWLLRRAFARFRGAPVGLAPKRGFGVPIGDWLRGPLRDWAEDLLSPVALQRSGLLAGPAVRAIWEQHLSGRRDRRFLLWNLLSFQAWYAARADVRRSADALPCSRVRA